MAKDDFPVMLASPFKEIDRIQFPCIAQTKLDGMRANIIIKGGKVEVFSRNGKPMNLFGQFDVLAELVKLDMVLDGELLVKNGEQILDRKTGNGILHKAVVGTISEEEARNVSIVLWDAILLEGFEKGILKMEYVERLKLLKHIPKTKVHDLVETFEVANLDEAQALFKSMLAKGQEGIILKNKHHPWENKRSKHIVKMKEVIESDMKIIGFAEGTGKASGMLGALQCENNDGTIRVDVGTGFTDEQRKDIWARREHLLNTIVTIKHNGIITRKDSKTKSMFLPVFVELRPDKDVAD